MVLKVLRAGKQDIESQMTFGSRHESAGAPRLCNRGRRICGTRRMFAPSRTRAAVFDGTQMKVSPHDGHMFLSHTDKGAAAEIKQTHGGKTWTHTSSFLSDSAVPSSSSSA